MFNPFKKKDDNNSFKLDEESIPSMTQKNGGTPSIPETNPNEELGMPNFDNMKTEQDFNAPLGSNPSSPSAPSNPFSSSNPFAASQPTQDNSQQESQTQQQNNNLHKDLTKAKLEMIESKISLMDAKIGNIDNKLEMIYQLILSEVSQETKAKLSINNAMDRLKKNQ